MATRDGGKCAKCCSLILGVRSTIVMEFLHGHTGMCSPILSLVHHMLVVGRWGQMAAVLTLLRGVLVGFPFHGAVVLLEVHRDCTTGESVRTACVPIGVCLGWGIRAKLRAQRG